MPARRRTAQADEGAAREAIRRRGELGERALDRTETKLLCRYLMALLAERAPGGSVEVRVPPFAAAQVIEGPRHTRGTPPAVVEMDPATWLALALGELTWHEAERQHRITASGQRADLSGYLPLADTVQQ